MSKVILSGYMIVPESELSAVTKALALHKVLTLEEGGCIIFKVTPCPNSKNRFDVYEEFADQIAFEHHQERVKSSVWGEVSKNVSRHYQISVN